MNNIYILYDEELKDVCGGAAPRAVAIDTPGGHDLLAGTPAFNAITNLPISVLQHLRSAGFSVDLGGQPT